MSKRAQERRTGRACGCKTEVYLFDFKKLSEPEATLVLRYASNVPGHPPLGSESFFRKHRETRAKQRSNSTACSQERNEDIPGKGSCGKLQRGVENQLERTRLDNHNMRISDYQYVEKILENVRQKLRLSSDTRCEDQRVDLGFCVDNNEISSFSHCSLPRELDYSQENQLRGGQDVVNITLRLIVEQSFEILNVSTMICTFSPWMRSTLCHD